MNQFYFTLIYQIVSKSYDLLVFFTENIYPHLQFSLMKNSQTEQQNYFLK